MAQQKKRSNRIIYILLAVLVGLVILVMVLKKTNKKEIEVTVAKPSRQTIVEKISASGMVQPVTEVKLSPDVAGEIIELNVEESDSVTLGQLLVKIRPDNYISAVQRAEASLSQQKANLRSSESNYSRAQATFERAKLEYDRNKKLHEQEVISDADWQLAEQNYKVSKDDLNSAKASVEAAQFIVKSGQAALADARENLRKTSVLSPISGTISKLSVKKGERVVGTSQFAGTEMLRIADLNDMEVRVDVNENDIIRISLGDTAIIDVDAYTHLNKKFKGIVTQIANTAKDKVSDDAVTEFEVKINILPSSYADLKEKGNVHPFKPGMTASVDIITESKSNILTLPLAAVTVRNPEEVKKAQMKDQEGDKEEGEKKEERRPRRGRGGNQPPPAEADEDSGDKVENEEVVFVNDNGIAKLVKVETGISDYENIEITSDLSDSAEVIVGPFIAVSKRLKDGDAVKVEQKKDDKDKPKDN
ncbi:MAG: efflux RND transporter periplasmic adaptor subunit [Cyclobacteriaceae bacterium]|nr:efflux RND transporter periplasmic adaptor subunit [Cyclobacteriaceae bacterium]